MRAALILLAALPLLPLAAAPPSAPASSKSASAGQTCVKPQPRLAETATNRIFRDEPVAFDLHAAMVRRIDGCIVPAILRRDVDGGRRAPAGRSRAPGLVRPL